MDKNLLFVGTQFGVFFSNDGGKEWIQMKNGLPTIAVMSLTSQPRENDLVVSTYGRSVYILDDYSPLRYLNENTLSKEAEIFPVKDALMFIPSTPFGFSGIGFMGGSFFSAPNPEVGAVFTYFIKDDVKSLKEKRRDLEKKKQKNGEDLEYPSYEEIRKEQDEPDAFLVFTITDENGNTVRKIKTGINKGVNRLIWDFRYNVFTPISLTPFDDTVPWMEPDKGYMVAPGKYYVSLTKYIDGNFTQLIEPKEFICKQLNLSQIPVEDKTELDKFNKDVAELTRIISGADAHRAELVKKIEYLKKAVFETSNAQLLIYNEVLKVENDLKELNRKFNGDGLKARYEGASPTSIKDRIDIVVGALWSTTSAPTTTLIKAYETANSQFGYLLNDLNKIADSVNVIEVKLKDSKAPYTPQRFPNLDVK